jgi:alkaline phosphatase
MILELLAMDKALGVALKWASNRTDTLVIVTADHETGGLSVAPGATEETVLENMNWTTTTHTTASVPFYVWGADETDYSLLNDTVDNTNIYDIIMSTYSSL